MENNNASNLSVRNGVDLLKNRNDEAKLSPFDGRVATHVTVSGLACFVTSNARYIPALPSGSANTLRLRKDMRYGPDDPTLWPQEYSTGFCHLGAIPKKPTTQRGKEALGVMWWDPDPKDFVSPESGLTLARGLGKLSHSQCSRLADPVNKLLEEYSAYTQTIKSPAKIVPLMPQLAQSLRLGLERLRTLPSTYIRVVINITNVQRCYLELMGMLRYMTVYKPRMEDPTAEPGLPDDCVGVFTSDPIVAQQFRIARLPYWLIRPLSTFLHENILSVVTPQETIGQIELEAAPGYPQMCSLHLCTQSTAWYKDPFKQPVPSAQQAVPSSSHSVPSSSLQTVPPSREPVSAPKTAPRLAKKHKQSQNPPKVERDKFLVFDSPEMPPGIDSWAKALSDVKRSVPPACGAQIQNRYVFPEPALLVSAADELRRHMILHHYQLMRDALLYRLGDPNDSHLLFDDQEWRDILQGKVARQGRTGTRAEARSASIEAVLAPAMEACGVDQYRDFPVKPGMLRVRRKPEPGRCCGRWRKSNFRFELLALDAPRFGLDRPDESSWGLRRRNAHDRLPYVLHLAGLMLIGSRVLARRR
ncbi:hypothetical protein B0H13DRAFT_1984044 [Mycena leptocephala]|nr:hypothetical protein B0H13DRAFT_1984044 [Mycena leptocephala]